MAVMRGVGGSRSAWAVCLWVVLVVGASRAAAQQPSGPPCVVHLFGGGMLRGTIVELVPNGPVTIVLPTGETRRIERSQIVFAGPATSTPAAPPPIVPAPAMPIAPPPPMVVAPP